MGLKDELWVNINKPAKLWKIISGGGHRNNHFIGKGSVIN